VSGEIITRFAPSPTGYLHIGHALAAKEVFSFQADKNEACLLRIEDIDHTRCRAEYTQAIYEDLAWLGFSWREEVRIQSQHLSDYAKVLDSLVKRGLVYRCFKTRKDMPSGVYRGQPDPREAEKLANNMPFAWRLSIDKCKEVLGVEVLEYMDTERTQTVSIASLSDEIVARKDIGTSYLIACTHDDAFQKITHVVRGQDIAQLTPYQVLLQRIMDWPVPVYIHHSLVHNAEGAKLSKRNKDTTIRSMRDQGFTPAQVLDMAEA
jgi:glutamyl-Q tRNA(Asp) synthetase